MASIRKHRSKWQVQVRRAGYQPLSRSFVTLRDAETWARQTEVALDRRDLVRPAADLARTTLGDLFRRYAVEVTPGKRGRQVEAIRLRVLERSSLARLTLRELSSSHLASYRDSRVHRVASSTVRREFTIIRHVLSTARREWGVSVARDILELVKLPAPPRGRERRLVDGEAAALLLALKADNPQVALVVRFALATALRRGELLAMRWCDLDLAGRTLNVPETKTGIARTIPLSLAAMAVLRELEKDLPESPVFRLTATSLRGAWERATRQAKIDELHLHDLRHEAISRFFEAGLSIPEVALISGHRDFRMLARYTHIRPSHVVARLDQVERKPHSLLP